MPGFIPSSTGRPVSPGRRRSPGRLPVVRLAGIALVTATALLLAVGCASTLSPRGSRPAGSATPAAAQADVPVASVRAARVRPANPRATATTIARHLLAALRLPGGSRRVAVPAGPIQDLPPAATGFADTVTLTRLYRLTVPMSAADRWLLPQHPAGAVVSGHGPFSQGRRVAAELVSFSVTSLPSWLYAARLATAVKPAAGGSLLLVQAQVQWYPARSPADYIDPARYGSVTVSRVVNHRTTARTLTGAPMRRLAAVINALHAMPDIPVVTPALGPGIPRYRLIFQPVGAAPAIVITPTSYESVDVTTNGAHGQPLFPPGTLIATARRILAAGPGAG